MALILDTRQFHSKEAVYIRVVSIALKDRRLRCAGPEHQGGSL